jgi:hypothetical protein
MNDLSGDVDVYRRLIEIDEKLDRVLTKMDNVETITVKVIEEIKPTLDELMNSSLVKMLSVGKKK